MFKRFVIPVLLVFGLSSLVRADVAVGWTKIETENFEFVGNADDASIRMVAESLERFRTALGKVMTIRGSVARTRVIVFKDSASFRAFKPLNAEGTPDERVLGLFVAGDDFNIIAVAADNLDLGTVYHEYVHDVVSSSFGSTRIPPWLNEGLASYFQTFRLPDGKTATFGSPRSEYLALLRTTPLIPWDEFFALDNFTLHRGAVNVRPVFYAQAWALASFLVNQPLNAIVEPDSMIAEIKKIERFKLKGALTFAGSEAALRRIEVVVSSPVSVVTSSPVSEAAANAILGDLLFRQRNSGAEALLARANELDPKLAESYTTLGQLRMRERRFGEAKRSSKRRSRSIRRVILLTLRMHFCSFGRISMTQRWCVRWLPISRAGYEIPLPVRSPLTRTLPKLITCWRPSNSRAVTFRSPKLLSDGRRA